MATESTILCQKVVGYSVTSLSFDAQINQILEWAKERCSKVVCVANVHMLIEANSNLALASVLQSADLVTPDGMPLVWMVSLIGRHRQDRVAGMDILLALGKRSSLQGVKLFFLGSQQSILDRMEERLHREFPNAQLAGMEPLPFRPLTSDEDVALIQKINESGANIVLVSLGCPKQEIWMAQHRDRIQAVMIGLGGVFPIYAGLHQWAPRWVRKAGLEWCYRLLQEPGRLWGRYSRTIPPFIFLALKQLIQLWLNANPSLDMSSQSSRGQ